jgi:glycosyltransferase involved in cell wall biosynthesis
MPQISVIICTYNRDVLLKMAIESLLNQNVNPLLYEIIVVNNNSDDNTEAVVKVFTENYSNIRIVLEPNQGLSHSRNRGYREAKAEYVAYMDDDAKVSPDWIEIAIKIINEQHPDIFGGPIYPFYLSSKPEWFKDEYEIRIHAEKTGWMKEGNISGSNIVFKKAFLQEYGGFNPQLGMRGSHFGYHEETNLLHTAYKDEKKIYYSHDLIVFHFVPDFKFSLAYFIYSSYKSGRDYISVSPVDFNFSDLVDLSKNVSQVMDKFEEALKRRDTFKYPAPENYIIEKVTADFFTIGRITEYFSKDNKIKIEDLLDYCLEHKIFGINDLGNYYVKHKFIGDSFMKRAKRKLFKILTKILSV